jgi:hypothetical protein
LSAASRPDILTADVEVRLTVLSYLALAAAAGQLRRIALADDADLVRS